MPLPRGWLLTGTLNGMRQMQSAKSDVFNTLQGVLAAPDDQSLPCDAVALPGCFLLTLSDKLKENQF